MFENTLLKTLKETGLPEAEVEPGLEGIGSFFAPLISKINGFFKETTFAAGFADLFTSRPRTLLDRDLQKTLNEVGYTAIKPVPIPRVANLAKDFPGYVELIKNSLNALGDVDQRIIIPLTQWLNLSVSSGPQGLPPRVKFYDVETTRKEIQKHFDFKRVDVRGHEVIEFGNLYKTIREFEQTGIELHALDKSMDVFNYERIIQAESKLLAAVKLFSNYDDPRQLDARIRNELITIMRKTGEELEMLATLLYASKVAAVNYKASQDHLKETFSGK